MKTATIIRTCALIFLGAGTTCAEPPGGSRQVIARYEARLSKRDHVSKEGKRLKTVAAILQRDREHIFFSNQGVDGEYQEVEDNPDPYFASREHLDEFEAALNRGHIDAAATRTILTATPVVAVTIYRDAGGKVALNVKFVRGGQTVVEEYM